MLYPTLQSQLDACAKEPENLHWVSLGGSKSLELTMESATLSTNVQTQTMNIEINDWHDSILDTSSSSTVVCLVSPNAGEPKVQPRAAFSEEEAKKLSVMVPKSFHKELRLYCASKDCTMTEVVVDALRTYLSRKE